MEEPVAYLLLAPDYFDRPDNNFVNNYLAVLSKYSYKDSFVYYKNQKIWTSQINEYFYQDDTCFLKLGTGLIIFCFVYNRPQFCGQYFSQQESFVGSDIVYYPFNWVTRDPIYNTNSAYIRAANNGFYQVYSVGFTPICWMNERSVFNIYSSPLAIRAENYKTGNMLPAKVAPTGTSQNCNTYGLTFPQIVDTLIIYTIPNPTGPDNCTIKFEDDVTVNSIFLPDLAPVNYIYMFQMNPTNPTQWNQYGSSLRALTSAPNSESTYSYTRLSDWEEGYFMLMADQTLVKGPSGNAPVIPNHYGKFNLPLGANFAMVCFQNNPVSCDLIWYNRAQRGCFEQANSQFYTVGYWQSVANSFYPNDFTSNLSLISSDNSTAGEPFYVLYGGDNTPSCLLGIANGVKDGIHGYLIGKLNDWNDDGSRLYLGSSTSSNYCYICAGLHLDPQVNYLEYSASNIMSSLNIPYAPGWRIEVYYIPNDGTDITFNTELAYIKHYTYWEQEVPFANFYYPTDCKCVILFMNSVPTPQPPYTPHNGYYAFNLQFGLYDSSLFNGFFYKYGVIPNATDVDVLISYNYQSGSPLFVQQYNPQNKNLSIISSFTGVSTQYAALSPSGPAHIFNGGCVSRTSTNNAIDGSLDTLFSCKTNENYFSIDGTVPSTSFIDSVTSRWKIVGYTSWVDSGSSITFNGFTNYNFSSCFGVIGSDEFGASYNNLNTEYTFFGSNLYAYILAKALAGYQYTCYYLDCTSSIPNVSSGISCAYYKKTVSAGGTTPILSEPFSSLSRCVIVISSLTNTTVNVNNWCIGGGSIQIGSSPKSIANNASSHTYGYNVGASGFGPMSGFTCWRPNTPSNYYSTISCNMASRAGAYNGSTVFYLLSDSFINGNPAKYAFSLNFPVITQMHYGYYNLIMTPNTNSNAFICLCNGFFDTTTPNAVLVSRWNGSANVYNAEYILGQQAQTKRLFCTLPSLFDTVNYTGGAPITAAGNLTLASRTCLNSSSPTDTYYPVSDWLCEINVGSSGLTIPGNDPGRSEFEFMHFVTSFTFNDTTKICTLGAQEFDIVNNNCFGVWGMDVQGAGAWGDYGNFGSGYYFQANFYDNLPAPALKYRFHIFFVPLQSGQRVVYSSSFTYYDHQFLATGGYSYALPQATRIIIVVSNGTDAACPMNNTWWNNCLISNFTMPRRVFADPTTYGSGINSTPYSYDVGPGIGPMAGFTTFRPKQGLDRRSSNIWWFTGSGSDGNRKNFLLASKQWLQGGPAKYAFNIWMWDEGSNFYPSAIIMEGQVYTRYSVDHPYFLYQIYNTTTNSITLAEIADLYMVMWRAGDPQNPPNSTTSTTVAMSTLGAGVVNLGNSQDAPSASPNSFVYASTTNNYKPATASSPSTCYMEGTPISFLSSQLPPGKDFEYQVINTQTNSITLSELANIKMMFMGVPDNSAPYTNILPKYFPSNSALASVNPTMYNIGNYVDGTADLYGTPVAPGEAMYIQDLENKQTFDNFKAEINYQYKITPCRMFKEIPLNYAIQFGSGPALGDYQVFTNRQDIPSSIRLNTDTSNIYYTFQLLSNTFKSTGQINYYFQFMVYDGSTWTIFPQWDGTTGTNACYPEGTPVQFSPFTILGKLWAFQITNKTYNITLTDITDDVEFFILDTASSDYYQFENLSDSNPGQLSIGNTIDGTIDIIGNNVGLGQPIYDYGIGQMHGRFQGVPSGWKTDANIPGLVSVIFSEFPLSINSEYGLYNGNNTILNFKDASNCFYVLDSYNDMFNGTGRNVFNVLGQVNHSDSYKLQVTNFGNSGTLKAQQVGSSFDVYVDWGKSYYALEPASIYGSYDVFTLLTAIRQTDSINDDGASQVSINWTGLPGSCVFFMDSPTGNFGDANLFCSNIYGNMILQDDDGSLQYTIYLLDSNQHPVVDSFTYYAKQIIPSFTGLYNWTWQYAIKSRIIVTCTNSSQTLSLDGWASLNSIKISMFPFRPFTNYPYYNNYGIGGPPGGAIGWGPWNYDCFIRYARFGNYTPFEMGSIMYNENTLGVNNISRFNLSTATFDEINNTFANSPNYMAEGEQGNFTSTTQNLLIYHLTNFPDQLGRLYSPFIFNDNTFPVIYTGITTPYVSFPLDFSPPLMNYGNPYDGKYSQYQVFASNGQEIDIPLEPPTLPAPGAISKFPQTQVLTSDSPYIRFEQDYESQIYEVDVYTSPDNIHWYQQMSKRLLTPPGNILVQGVSQPMYVAVSASLPPGLKLNPQGFIVTPFGVIQKEKIIPNGPIIVGPTVLPPVPAPIPPLPPGPVPAPPPAPQPAPPAPAPPPVISPGNGYTITTTTPNIDMVFGAKVPIAGMINVRQFPTALKSIISYNAKNPAYTPIDTNRPVIPYYPSMTDFYNQYAFIDNVYIKQAHSSPQFFCYQLWTGNNGYQTPLPSNVTAGVTVRIKDASDFRQAYINDAISIYNSRVIDENDYSLLNSQYYLDQSTPFTEGVRFLKPSFNMLDYLQYVNKVDLVIGVTGIYWSLVDEQFPLYTSQVYSWPTEIPSSFSWIGLYIDQCWTPNPVKFSTNYSQWTECFAYSSIIKTLRGAPQPLFIQNSTCREIIWRPFEYATQFTITCSKTPLFVSIVLRR